MMNNPWFLLLLFVLSLFQMVLLHVIPLFAFFDEAITIWALYIIITNYKFNINKRFDWMLIIMCMITIYGVICNYHFNYQTNIIPILNDIGNCFKVFITYIGASLYFRRLKLRIIDDFLVLAYNFVSIFIVVMFPFCILNMFVDIGMHQDVRYGIPSFAFIFEGAGKLSMLFYLMMSVILLHYKKIKSPSFMDLAIFFMALVIWTSTMRARAFLFVLVLLFVFGYVIYAKKRLEINRWSILIGLLLFITICADQIEYYGGDESSARYSLLYNGYRTMVDYFPFGCGFGTYGTDVAAKYYSKLYIEYGMNNVYGLTEDNPIFSHDNYWPAIMGQFGAIGMLGFVSLVYLLFSDMMKKSRNSKLDLSVAVFLCFSQIMASFATAVFSNFVTVWLMFFAAMFFNRKDLRLRTYSAKIKLLKLIKKNTLDT